MPPRRPRSRRAPSSASARSSTCSRPSWRATAGRGCSARAGAADAYALMLCRWTRHFARPASRPPRLGDDVRRDLERPTVRTVFESEGIAAPWV